jgi:hypothetical protein
MSDKEIDKEYSECEIVEDLRAKFHKGLHITKKQANDFLAIYAASGNVALSSRAIGLNSSLLYVYMSKNPEVRAEFEQIRATTADKLLDVLTKAAFEGDIDTAKWLLPRLDPKFVDTKTQIFSLRQLTSDHTDEEIKALIMSGLTDDSDEKV